MSAELNQETIQNMLQLPRFQQNLPQVNHIRDYLGLKQQEMSALNQKSTISLEQLLFSATAVGENSSKSLNYWKMIELVEVCSSSDHSNCTALWNKLHIPASIDINKCLVAIRPDGHLLSLVDLRRTTAEQAMDELLSCGFTH